MKNFLYQLLLGFESGANDYIVQTVRVHCTYASLRASSSKGKTTTSATFEYFNQVQTKLIQAIQKITKIPSIFFQYHRSN